MRVPIRSTRLRALLALGVLLPAGAATGLVTGAAGSHAAVSQTMNAYVHDDASIGLAFADGTPAGSQALQIPVIPPGTYSIAVLDDTTEHDFHLFGPGVDDATDIGGMATTTWSVTLQPGQMYRFQCDAHPDFMWGVFKTSGTATSSGVTSTSTTPAPSTAVTSTPAAPAASSTSLRGTLVGTVGATGKTTLSLAGKAVSKLKAGRYRVTIVDRSSSRGFVLRRAGHAPITVSRAAVVGRRSVTVQLTPGRWTYAGAARAAAAGAFSVTA